MRYLSYSNFKPFHTVKYIFMKQEDWDMKSRVEEQVSGISKSESGAVRINQVFPNTAATILMHSFRTGLIMLVETV